MLRGPGPLCKGQGFLSRNNGGSHDGVLTRLFKGFIKLIQAKDSLDYHRAMQGLLKGWLFVHIPLTYAMLVFIFVHVVLVHAFRGGAS